MPSCRNCTALRILTACDALQVGQNEVKVIRLPVSLESDSIRVETLTTSPEQNLTVFDVVYTPPLYDKDTSNGETWDLLKERKAALQSQLSILEQQRGVLESYSNSLSGKDTSAEQLESFLEVYANRKSKIHQETTKINQEISKLDKEITKLRKASKSEHEARRSTGVTIIINSEEEGPGEIVLSYSE